MWLCLATLLLAAGIARADDYSDITRLTNSGQATEALARADRALAAKPRDPQMRFLRAVALTELGRKTEAIAAYTDLTRENPELAEPHNNLAVVHASLGEYDKARAALEQAIRANPGYAIALENLGDMHARLAAQAWARAMRLEPGNTSAPPKLALVRQLFGGGATAGAR
jgi:Flp pilus assembly protein TadD